LPKRTYEGLFLLDPVMHGANPTEMETKLKTLMQNQGAEITSFGKWDERKLAYPIKNPATKQAHLKGVYYLSMFEAEGNTVEKIYAEAKLCGYLLRCMMVQKVKEYAEMKNAFGRDDDDMGIG